MRLPIMRERSRISLEWATLTASRLSFSHTSTDTEYIQLVAGMLRSVRNTGWDSRSTAEYAVPDFSDSMCITSSRGITRMLEREAGTGCDVEPG